MASHDDLLTALPAPRHLLSANAQARFIGYGPYAPLIRAMAYQMEPRATLERWALRAQSWLPQGLLSCRDAGLLRAWHDVILGLEQVPSAALFLITAHYKNTMFVGPVGMADGRQFFIKLYKEMHDAIHAVRQVDFMQLHFTGSFGLLEIEHQNAGLVTMPLVQRGDDVLTMAELQEAGMDWCLGTFAVYRRELRSLDTFILLDLPFLFKKHGRENLWPRIRQALAQLPAVPIMPIHGDFTPWNAFRDPRGQIVLVDYERCGWHVPFYDLFHLVVQVNALQGRTVYPDRLIKDIATQAKVAISDVELWFLLYLLDQLRLDLDERYNKNRTHPQLLMLIEARLRLLETMIHSAP